MDDLILRLEFLESAKEGISINRVIFRKPTLTTFSDSSDTGIGGFCPQTGIMWRCCFTEAERQSFTLDTKEYIASVIDMEIQVAHDPCPNLFSCTLNRSDSTSTVGCIEIGGNMWQLTSIRTSMQRRLFVFTKNHYSVNS